MSGVASGSAGVRGRAHTNPGADGEECEYERAAGQWQWLLEQLPAESQSATAWDSAEGQRLHAGRIPEGLAQSGIIIFKIAE